MHVWSMIGLLLFSFANAAEHLGQDVVITSYREGALQVPIKGCEGRNYKIVENATSVRTVMVDGKKTGEFTLSSRFVQKPECDPNHEYIPNANLYTGSLWNDFYNDLKDYGDARELALAAGKERLAHSDEHRDL